jgi:hypothetical protein
VAATGGEAISQPTTTVVPVSPPTSRLPFTANLDGHYIWLGVSGAATRDDGTWDSVFGMELTVLRVRESAVLGVVGVGLAGSRIATDERWRVTLEAVVGTRLAGRTTAGLAIGPTVDLAELAHPEYGISARAWVFVGITPYVRVGVMADGSKYVDLGAQLSLPIARF